MRDEQCIFCKIANGEIPSSTIFEDEKFRVFLDLGPASKGHALVVPKDHYENLFAMPEDLLGEAFTTAKKTAEKMRAAFHPAGFNIVQNNGPVAGQTVFHFHIHVIPRYEDDGQKIGWAPGSLTPEAAAEICAELEKA